MNSNASHVSASQLSFHAGRVNQAISFTTGQFAGATVRAELREIQAPSLGRKYARVDRRPLDPPPVAELQFFRSTGEHYPEYKLPNDQIQIIGLICFADLFSVPPPDPLTTTSPIAQQLPVSASPYSRQQLMPYTHPNAGIHRGDSAALCHPPTPENNRVSAPDIYQQHPSLYNPRDRNSIPSFHTALPHPSFPGPSSPIASTSSHQEQDISQNGPITALVGSTFVQPMLIDWQSKRTLIFVFPDLSVNMEGMFILRYRVFDIYSRGQNEDPVILAECYGRPFRVYATKEFPGLTASTELSKQIARQAYGTLRINIRETERVRKTQKRKHPFPTDDSDED